MRIPLYSHGQLALGAGTCKNKQEAFIPDVASSRSFAQHAQVLLAGGACAAAPIRIQLQWASL